MLRRTIIISVLLLTTNVSAQPATDLADAEFRQGNSLYKEQRWAEARDAYDRAWQLKKAHDIAANLAYAEMKLGRFREAAEHLAFAVKSWPPTGKTDKREYAIDRLQLARKEVGALKIEVNLPRADVLIDGQRVGQAPLDGEVFVEAGTHTIEAKLVGYATASRSVDATKGGAAEVALVLRVAAAPAPPPVVQRPVWPAVVSGVLAVGGLAAGAGLAVAAHGKSADASMIGARLGGSSTCAGTPGAAMSADCTAVKEALRGKSTLSEGAFVGLLGGGIFALATAGLVTWTAMAPKVNAEPRMTMRVVPVAGLRDAGLVVVGTW
jgi:hypothetical protein